MIELASPTPFVKAWRKGTVGHVMLDRPDRRNALNRDMWAALPGLISGLDGDPDTRVLVLEAAGSEAFAAGAVASLYKPFTRQVLWRTLSMVLPADVAKPKAA